MAMMGNDHYALDTTRARQLLGWENQHTLKGDLPAIIAEMKRDPVGWYQRHRIKPTEWATAAHAIGRKLQKLRVLVGEDAARERAHVEHAGHAALHEERRAGDFVRFRVEWPFGFPILDKFDGPEKA